MKVLQPEGNHLLKPYFTKPGFLCTAGCLFLSVMAVQAEEPIAYETHVAPILQQRCAPCHYPDGGKKAKGKFDLTSYALMMKGGESGLAIVPSSLEESSLVAMIEWKAETLHAAQ